MRFASLEQLDRIRTAAGSQADYALIRQQVEQGQAVFCEFKGLYCVLRHDHDGLVVVAAAGKNLRAAAPLIVEIARKANASAIIYHTKRAGLKQLLSAYNFKFLMTDSNGYFVFRMGLDG